MIVKFVRIIIIIISVTCPIYLHVSAYTIANPGCNPQCGEFEIPYPFGIRKNGSDCYADKWFEIECRNNTTPYLKSLGVQVTSIDFSAGTVSIMNPIYRSNCKRKDALSHMNQLGGSPFVYSKDYNKFVAIGCNNIAFLQSNGSDVSGCASTCDNDNDDVSNLDLTSNECNGKSCCQTSLPSHLTEYSIKIERLKENQTGHHCSYAMIVEKYSSYSSLYGYDVSSECYSCYVGNSGYFYSSYRNCYDCYIKNSPYISIGSEQLKDVNDVAAVLEWEIQNNTIHTLPKNDDTHNCEVTNVTSSNSGWRCTCISDFIGNPYIAGGCTADTPRRDYPESPKVPAKPIITGVSASIGSIILVIVLWRLFKVVRIKIVKKIKQKFYKRNGGLLLEQRLSSGEVNADKVKHFSLRDLEKATDYFNKNRVLGKGGQGTVYKGMLSDGKIIAVKKFKVQGNVEEFINEFIILSQINHRNVVKLLGCCLETKIPLLVYEFIPNGNLFEYLHEQNEDLPISWEMRLRIAAEVAGALFYLHSVASQPIYHRDIKSTNILLDEKYRAKVADFGTSRMISIEATHLTTVVQGTFGYLDPEYFHTSQFTEKSDVYSFGVVLVELLTGQRPISSLRPQEAKSVAPYFILCLEENRLFDIIDERVMKDGKKEHIIAVANLAGRCLELNGKKRPTMKEVTLELEGFRKLEREATTQEKHDELEIFPIQDYQSWANYSTSNLRCIELNGKKRPTMKEVTLELEGIRKLEREATTQERHDELELVPIQDYQSWAEYSTTNLRSTFHVISRTQSFEDIHILTV